MSLLRPGVSKQTKPNQTKPDVRANRFMEVLLYSTIKNKDKDPFIGPQEFVVGYSKAPEQPQSSARHVYVILTLWGGRGANQPPYALQHIGARRATHCATGDDLWQLL